MVIILFILFASLLALYVLDFKNETVKNIITIILAIILICLAGFRAKDLDYDYYVYRDFWRTNKLLGNVEFSFYLIREFVKNTLNLGFQYLLLIYAVLGVSFKFAAIRKFAPFLWGSLLIYLSHYFLLHEFTQIRIGVATGFLLLSLYYLTNKNYIVFFIFAGFAIFFHQSTFFIILFPLLTNSEKKITYYYWLIPIGYFLYFFNTYSGFTIPIPGIQDKIDFYEKATKSGFLKETKTNVFNALFLIRILIFYILLYYSKKISPHFNGFYLLMKIYSLSLFSFLFLAKIPVFAFRVQELLGVVEIILIPCLILIFSDKFRYLGVGLIGAIALGMFLLDIYYVKLIYFR